MRKLVFAVFIAAISIVGLSTAASAATLGSHSSHGFCDFNPKPKSCVPTNPGTPDQCTATSIQCASDTLSFTDRTRGHDGNWNNGPQDPCIIHRYQNFGDSQNSDFRGCHCQVVKIWHSKIVCNREVWYYTLETICRGHHRDPRQCGCQVGSQLAPAIRQAA